MTRHTTSPNCRSCGKPVEPHVVLICDGCFERLLGQPLTPSYAGKTKGRPWWAHLSALGRRGEGPREV